MHLGRAERPQRFAELARPHGSGVGPRAQRRLEPPRRALRCADAVPQRRREIHEPIQDRRIDGRCTKPRRLPECRLRHTRALGRLFGEHRRARDLFLERARLGGERRAPTLQLEQDGLGRLAREPELASSGVVPKPFRGDGRGRDVEQRVEGNDRKLAHEILRRASREHGEAAEAGGASALQESEATGRVVREDSCRSRAKRSRNGALLARRDVERREREPGPVFRERASGRRKALLLGECLLERADALADERRAFGQRGALPLGRARGFSRAHGLELERGERVAVHGGLVPRSLGPEPLDQCRRRLHPELESFDAPLQPVAGRNGRLATARGVRELLLGASTIRQHSLEPPLRPSLRERHRVAPLHRLRAPRAGRGQIELGDARAETGDLTTELLGALCSRRLERERPQPLAHFVLDVAGALDLERHASQLQLGAMSPPLELPEPCRLLDERAPILRLGRENLLDLALADDGVHRGAQPHVGENLHEVGTSNGSAVDEILALAAPSRAVLRSRPRRSRAPATCRPRCRRRARPRSAPPPSGLRRRRRARRRASQRAAPTA